MYRRAIGVVQPGGHRRSAAVLAVSAGYVVIPGNDKTAVRQDRDRRRSLIAGSNRVHLRFIGLKRAAVDGDHLVRRIEALQVDPETVDLLVRHPGDDIAAVGECFNIGPCLGSGNRTADRERSAAGRAVVVEYARHDVRIGARGLIGNYEAAGIEGGNIREGIGHAGSVVKLEGGRHRSAV